MTVASEVVHDDTKTCKKCKYWIASKSWDLHTAHRRLIDADRLVAIVHLKRSHGIASEAHFHSKGATCNERCVK